MTRILISSCLIGRKVRYDGGHKAVEDAALERWQREGRLVALCPELAGGFQVPRPPAEILDGTGGGVLDGTARIGDATGADVTGAFVKGAEAAVALALSQGCSHAILMDGSPSCGTTFLYDGTFTGRGTEGRGVAAEALARAGVKVWPAERIAELAAEIEAEEHV